MYDEPLVLWRNSEGQLVCLQDLCPHRAAKLSDGHQFNQGPQPG
ncbi:MAG: Rieske 2Fe-2S domain-containing protein [Hormoscilla sp. GM7CHS1pb]|nr:Rieske 2Fe-2S domain-containing protein [Hormoscilla sp. GM7CHS1pb]